VERDVRFAGPDDSLRPAVDDAYRSKYSRYGGTYVSQMIGDDPSASTLRLIPR
jgi:hypothetical protein